MMQNPPTPSEQTLLEEYRMLRTDLHQRINFRFQVFNLLLVALGAVWSVGLDKGNAHILLIYPVLALFLTLNWIHQGMIMIKLSRYLLEELEPKLPGLNWEAWVHKDSRRFSGFSAMGLWAAGGFIVVTEVLTLALAFGMQWGKDWSGLGMFLAVIGVAFTLLTLYFLIRYHRLTR